jgi:O-antigen/teichoic acid export membrane protein
MSAIAKLIKGGAWLTLANVVSKLASALVLPVLARLLGPQALGIYSIVFSLAQSAQGFSSLGADVAMHRNGAQYQTIGTEAVGRLFGVGLSLICLVSAVTGLGVWFFRDPLAQHWLGQPEVTPWLGAAALLIVLQPFSNIPLLFLASLQDFRAYALRSSVEMVFASALVVLLAWKFELAGAVLGLVVAKIAQIPWSYFVAKPVLQARGIRLRIDQFLREAQSILKFGFPYYCGNTLLGSLVGLPLMGLVSQYGGLEELGYLRVAQSMAALIGFIPSAIAPAAISYLSASSVDNNQSYQYLKSVHLRGVWALLLVPTSAVCLILPDVINWLFGSAYQQATVLSWLSLWISALAGVVSVLVQYLLVAGKTVRVAWASLLGVIFWILAAFIFVPQYRALGFLIAQSIGQIVGLLVVLRPAIVDFDIKDVFLLANFLTATFLLFIWSLILLLLSLALPLITADYPFKYLVMPITILISFTWLFVKGLHPVEKTKIKKLLEVVRR